MTTRTFEVKVHDFLAQKRIAVAGVSRNHSHHPVGNLIYQRLKTTGHDVFPVNPHMQTFEGNRCYPDLKSIPGGVDGDLGLTLLQVPARAFGKHEIDQYRHDGYRQPARQCENRKAFSLPASRKAINGTTVKEAASAIS